LLLDFCRLLLLGLVRSFSCGLRLLLLGLLLELASF